MSLYLLTKTPQCFELVLIVNRGPGSVTEISLALTYLQSDNISRLLKEPHEVKAIKP